MNLKTSGIIAGYILSAIIAVLVSAGLIADWRESREPFRYSIDGPNHGPHHPPFIAPGIPAVEIPVQAPLARLVLVGDAGLPASDTSLPNVKQTTPAQLFQSLEQWTSHFPAVTTTLYLGDNLYPDGYEQDDDRYAREVLGNQLRAGGRRSIFIPGNHDWGDDGTGLGFAPRLLRQQQFVEGHDGAVFAPRNGCPFPEVFTLIPDSAAVDRAVKLVVFDSQWLFMPRFRPACDGYGEHQLYNELQDILDLNKEHHVILAAHHPLKTAASHGGYRRGYLRKKFASLLTLQGSVGAPRYNDFQHNMRSVTQNHPPLVYVSGHDHALQVFEEGQFADYLLVSGSAAKTKDVTILPDSLFAHGGRGFMVLDFFPKNGQVITILHVVQPGSSQALLSIALPAR